MVGSARAASLGRSTIIGGVDVDATLLRLISPAMAAAREALRRMDDDDVPARLRRVRASAARTLPPPLAAVLVDALDEDEALRNAALDRLDDDAPGVAVARFFLTRPDGWEEELDLILAEERARAEEADAADREAELARLRSRAEADAGRIAELRKEVADLTARVAEERRRRSSAVADAVDRARTEASHEVDRLGRRVSELEPLAERLAETRERLASARDEVLALRRRPTGPAPEERPDEGWVGDALGLARHADEVFAAARARIHPAGETRAASDGSAVDPDELEPVLPPGVRPDSADAVDALLGWRGVVLVDGYNLAGELGADLEDPARARDLVRRVVERFEARGGASVVVVFDSAEGEGERPGEVFVADADEELRRRSSVEPGRTVVVSNDREVIEGVTAAGAVAVWSTALAQWAGR